MLVREKETAILNFGKEIKTRDEWKQQILQKGQALTVELAATKNKEKKLVDDYGRLNDLCQKTNAKIIAEQDEFRALEKKLKENADLATNSITKMKKEISDLKQEKRDIEKKLSDENYGLQMALDLRKVSKSELLLERARDEIADLRKMHFEELKAQKNVLEAKILEVKNARDRCQSQSATHSDEMKKQPTLLAQEKARALQQFQSAADTFNAKLKQFKKDVGNEFLSVLRQTVPNQEYNRAMELLRQSKLEKLLS